MVLDNFKKIIIHKNFNSTLHEIKKIDFALSLKPSELNIDLQKYTYPLNGNLVEAMEQDNKFVLNPKRGEEYFLDGHSLFAYDESILKFMGLEGSAYLTCHSLVYMDKSEYLPCSLITMYFYTKSKLISDQLINIKYSDDPDMESKRDFIKDKLDFLVENVSENSILLIDGPLIGGDVYTYMIRAIDRFLEKNVIPLFFVKNSNSNLVVDNMGKLAGNYNSDLHWAYKFLNRGERTNFFAYADRNNPDNAKIFCYIKGFNVSPQRVEMHRKTYAKYINIIPSLMDQIYYFLIAQGDQSNPQVRPIAIAEKYARASLKLINFDELIKGAGINPTMNQERFAWS